MTTSSSHLKNCKGLFTRIITVDSSVNTRIDQYIDFNCNIHTNVTSIKNQSGSGPIQNVSRKAQYEDVYKRTIENLQRVLIFKANCCLKVHYAHLKLALLISGKGVDASVKADFHSEDSLKAFTEVISFEHAS